MTATTTTAAAAAAVKNSISSIDEIRRTWRHGGRGPQDDNTRSDTFEHYSILFSIYTRSFDFYFICSCRLRRRLRRLGIRGYLFPSEMPTIASKTFLLLLMLRWVRLRPQLHYLFKHAVPIIPLPQNYTCRDSFLIENHVEDLAFLIGIHRKLNR